MKDEASSSVMTTKHIPQNINCFFGEDGTCAPNHDLLDHHHNNNNSSVAPYPVEIYELAAAALSLTCPLIMALHGYYNYNRAAATTSKSKQLSKAISRYVFQSVIFVAFSSRTLWRPPSIMQLHVDRNISKSERTAYLHIKFPYTQSLLTTTTKQKTKIHNFCVCNFFF